jgi:SAM-dependent methyltransferase
MKTQVNASRPNADCGLDGIGDEKYFRHHYGTRSPHSYAWILAEIIVHGKSGSILDLGCGVGLFVELARRWGIVACGVDGSDAAIDIGLTRFAGLDLRPCNLGSALPFDDGSFDNILLNQVVEHLSASVQEQVLRQSHRLLKRGGVLFVYSPSKANKSEVEKDPTHCNPLFPSELRRLLEVAEFRIFKEPNFPLVSGRIPVFGRLARRVLRTRFVDRVSATANAYALRP